MAARGVGRLAPFSAPHGLPFYRADPPEIIFRPSIEETEHQDRDDLLLMGHRAGRANRLRRRIAAHARSRTLQEKSRRSNARRPRRGLSVATIGEGGVD
jgi:hypothetical protein